jgi:outer membrane lipoprotein-sorting protein
MLEETPRPLPFSGYKKEFDMKTLRIGNLAVWKWTTIATTVAGLALFLGLVFSAGQASAFARMQKALMQFDTLQFSSELYLPDREDVWRSSKTMIKGKEYIRDEKKIEELGNPIDIFDLTTGRYAKLSTELKKAAIGNISEAQQKQLMKITNSFVSVLTNANAEDADEVDRYEKEGRSMIEFEYIATIGPNTTAVNVIVDAESSLPIEIRFYGANGALERLIKNIVFDEPLEDSLFSTEAPEDYEVIEMDIE